MNWRFSFILLISLNQVWSHPYRKYQRNLSDNPNDWHYEQHQFKQQQQQSDSYEYPNYSSYDHPYQRPHDHQILNNFQQQQQNSPLFNPSRYQATNNEELNINYMNPPQQSNEFDIIHSQQHESDHQQNMKIEYTNIPQRQVFEQDTDPCPEYSDSSSHDHINQREIVQNFDTFYKQTDKYNVPGHSGEIGHQTYDHISQYQDQINEQETEPLKQQSAIEHEYQGEDKSPKRYNTQDTEPSDQQYNINFGTQKELEKPNEYIESEEFGLHSHDQIGEQRQQTSILYSSNEEGLGEQQSNMEFGFQQEAHGHYNFENSQVTDNFGQQADFEFGSKQQEIQTNKYTNTQGKETLLHQQTNSEFGSIYQKEKPSQLLTTPRTEIFENNPDPKFGLEEQVKSSDRNYHDSQQLEQNQPDLTIEYDKTSNQSNNNQNIEQQLHQEPLDQKPNKYTNIQYTVPLEEQYNIEFDSQHSQVPIETLDSQKTEISDQQLHHQNQAQQEPEELEQQSALEFGSEQVQSFKTYIDHQVESDGEQLFNVDFGSQKTTSEINDKQKTEEFGQQSHDQLMPQRQQIAQFTDSIEEQTNTEHTLHEQEQRSSKYTDSKEIYGQQHIGLTPDLEFGSQYQGQFPNSHSRDHDTAGVYEQQSNIEFGYQGQTPSRYNDESEVEQFEQQSPRLVIASHQQHQNPNKNIDAQQNDTMIEQQTNTEFGSQEEQKQNDYNIEQETDKIVHQSNSQLVNQFHSVIVKKNSQDEQTIGEHQYNMESGSQQHELTLNTNSQSQKGNTATKQQTIIEFDSVEQYKSDNYTVTQEAEESEHQSDLGVGFQQKLTSENYTNNLDVNIMGEQQSNIEFGSQLQQNSKEFNDNQEIEELGQQSVLEFGLQQQDYTTKNFSNIDYDNLDEQQLTIESGLQQQKPIESNNKQDTEQSIQQLNLPFGSQQQYQNAEDVTTLVNHHVIEFGLKQEQNQNGYNYKKDTDQIIQQSNVQFEEQQINTPTSYTYSQHEESQEIQSNIDIEPQQHELNPKIHSFSQEIYGQQSDLEFGVQQEHKPFKYTDTQEAQTSLHSQTNIQFGSQVQQKLHNSQQHSDSLGRTQVDSEVGSHDNEYSELQQHENHQHNDNTGDQQITVVSQKHLKVNEKDPYDCLNVKVDELEKELSSKLDDISTTSTSRPIDQLNVTNNNYTEVNTGTSDIDIYEQQKNENEQEHSEISITIKPNVMEHSPSPPKESFWQKVQNKMSETYSNVQNKASDIVKKVKNKISTET